MLNEIERKLTGLLGDGLAARAHLQVVEGDSAVPDAGKGVVEVILDGFSEEPSFTQERFSIGSTAAKAAAPVRRVLPVQFQARVAFLMRPQDATPAASTAARILMLQDISLTAHLLAADDIRVGTGFQTGAADPGFEVSSFALEKSAMPAGLTNGLLTGELRYRGAALIWPPGITQDQGKIVAVDPVVQALPITTSVDSPVVFAGSGGKVRLRSVGGSRLADPNTGQRVPLRLAVTVVSDLPMGQRGSITSGDAGVQTGFRIVTATPPETVVDYVAPPGNLGSTRVEFVAFYLARPDGNSGVFLGSAAVALLPGGAG